MIIFFSRFIMSRKRPEKKSDQLEVYTSEEIKDIKLLSIRQELSHLQTLHSFNDELEQNESAKITAKEILLIQKKARIPTQRAKNVIRKMKIFFF